MESTPDDFDELEEDLEEMEDQLDEAKTRMFKLEKSLHRLEKNIASIKDNIERNKENIKTQEKEIADFKQSIEAARQAFSEEQVAAQTEEKIEEPIEHQVEQNIVEPIEQQIEQKVEEPIEQQSEEQIELKSEEQAEQQVEEEVLATESISEIELTSPPVPGLVEEVLDHKKSQKLQAIDEYINIGLQLEKQTMEKVKSGENVQESLLDSASALASLHELATVTNVAIAEGMDLDKGAISHLLEEPSFKAPVIHKMKADLDLRETRSVASEVKFGRAERISSDQGSGGASTGPGAPPLAPPTSGSNQEQPSAQGNQKSGGMKHR